MLQGRKIPKRFWWTKRIFACWLLLLAALVGTRYWWNHLAEQRLSAELAAIQARGERVDWVNMAPPPLPAEQNAVLFYQRAAASLPPLRAKAGIGMLNDLSAIPSFRATHAAEVEAILSACPAVFEQCRLARDIPRANWGIAHTSPGYNAVLPSLGSMRELAKLLRLRATWQAEHGDSAGAVETLRDMEALGRAVSMNGTLIGSLVSIAIHDITTWAIEEATPLLSVTAGPTTTQPAAPQAMRAMIAELLVDHPLTALHEGLIAERAAMNDTVVWGMDGGSIPSLFGVNSAGVLGWLMPGSWPGLVSPEFPTRVIIYDLYPQWLLAPMYRCDQTNMLIYYDQLVAMASQPTMTKTEQFSRSAEDSLACLRGDDMRSMPRPFSTFLLPSLGRAAYLAHRCVAERRMAAVALALRLFELEKGRAAESLDQLTPEYLPSAPRDPFDPAEGPIRALLADAKPRLYSLGENKLDDGGVTTATPPATSLDIVLFLRPGDRPEEQPYSTASQPTSIPATEPTTAPSSDDGMNQP